MGAALTYARRYALLLVGIAGEDDLDAPDLNEALPRPTGSDEPGQPVAGDSGSGVQPDAAIPASFAPTTAPTPDYGRRKPVRLQCVLLPADHSLALREKLNSELKGFTDTDALTAWAQRILALKNQLTTSDAQEVEKAFVAKLSELGDDVEPLIKPEVVVRVQICGDSEPATAAGSSSRNSAQWVAK